MKQNIENIIAENSVETTNKEYGNGIFISTDAVSNIAQDIVKLFSIPVVMLQGEQLQALEDLKEWCYDNANEGNNERVYEILERL